MTDEFRGLRREARKTGYSMACDDVIGFVLTSPGSVSPMALVAFMHERRKAFDGRMEGDVAAGYLTNQEQDNG